MGVKKATTYRWVKTQDAPPKQRGGKRRTIITEENRIQIEKFIEENPKITLKGIEEKLCLIENLKVTTECIRQHLDGMLYTIKNFKKEPERANSKENKIKRREYLQRLLEFQGDNRPIVYMDETNFNLFISRSKGRSKKGSRCTYVSAGSKGSNIHLIGCIGSFGMIYHEIKRGSFKKQEARAFIRICLRKAINLYSTSIVMVIHNAPCHASIEDVFKEHEFRHNKLLRLAPYSPMFNAIESIWSIIKAGVKRDLGIQMPSIIAGEGRTDISQTEFRTRCLENTMNENISQITVMNCVNCIANVQRFIADALNMIDMVF